MLPSLPNGPDLQLDSFLERYMGVAGRFLERVMIFIDAGYLYACVRDQFHSRPVDVVKFAAKLTGRRRLMRAYYYTARIESPPNDYFRSQQQSQQKYMAALAHAPLVEVRWGRLQFSNDGAPRQKGVDVLLSLDMLRFALKDNYDTAVLVSGDGDFADIVRMVKDEGKKVEVITFPRTRAWALLEAADVSIEVNEELMEECWREEQQQEQEQEARTDSAAK